MFWVLFSYLLFIFVTFQLLNIVEVGDVAGGWSKYHVYDD